MLHLQFIAGLQNTQGVLAHILHGGVSMDTGDAQDLHAGGGQGQHDGLSIIHPAVNIHQQLRTHTGPCETHTLFI